jgi:hypothetical protein
LSEFLPAKNATLPPPQQLPEVLNELHRTTVDVKYFFARRFAAGVVYWFDKYNVEDFALSPSTDHPDQHAEHAAVGNMCGGPTPANTVWARLSCFW